MGKSTKPPANAIRPVRRKRRLMFRAGMLALAAFAGAYWYSHRQDAQVTTAYAAIIACSCHYVAGRELGPCKDDFRPGMGFVILSDDKQDRSVTAWLPFFGGATARYEDGPGCVLDSWDG